MVLFSRPVRCRKLRRYKMAVDPVCRMQVDEETAEKEGNSTEYNGKTYYFCAKACVEKFEGDPEKYL